MSTPRTDKCPHCGGEMEQSMGDGYFEASDYACQDCGVSSHACVMPDKSIWFVPIDMEPECDSEEQEP